MKSVLWLRIILTGLAMEVVYGLYISFVRWYEASPLTNALTLGFLMVIGGYWVGTKSNSKHLLHGALVGLVGVLFYLLVTMVLTSGDEVSYDLEFWIGNLAKIGGGVCGGYIASVQGKNYGSPG